MKPEAEPKKMVDFPEAHHEAFMAGYFHGQRGICDTLLEEERAKYEHVLGLLRDSKMKHGLCEPRSRKACTACNAQDLLDVIIKEWKGFTMRLSTGAP